MHHSSGAKQIELKFNQLFNF